MIISSEEAVLGVGEALHSLLGLILLRSNEDRLAVVIGDELACLGQLLWCQLEFLFLVTWINVPLTLKLILSCVDPQVPSSVSPGHAPHAT